MFMNSRRKSALRYTLIVLLNLGAGPTRGQDFQITDLSAVGCSVVDHGSITGDDRGGIAASLTHVFYTGDSATGRFDLEDLSGGVSVGQRYDAMVSDLSTGTMYSLGDGDTPITSAGGTVTTLLEIDGTTGALTGDSISLSMPITATSSTGIFAGFGRAALHTNGVAYDVALPSGEVTDLGAMPTPAFRSCENWAYWGVAEYFGDTLYLVYRASSGSQIVRSRVPDGETTTVAAFSNLSDMCSFTVSPANDRWYFHHEGSSQFGGTSETVGFCQAALAMDGVADLSLTKTDSADPAEVGTSFFYTLTVTNDGPDEATEVRVTDRLPGTLELVSAVPSQGTCGQVCDAVICDLGALPNGASATITLEVIPWLSGTRINGATVFGDQIDPDLSNNEVLEGTEVTSAGSDLSLISIGRSSGRLRLIDPSSGDELARLDLRLPGATIDEANGLAIHPTTGELWALLELFEQAGRELVTLDPSTGTVTRIGNTGDRFAGLAFDDAGTLYGITGRGAATPESLFVLSQIDATPTFVISLADGLGGEAIAFAPDGLIYHASNDSGFESIDPAGPTVTDIGTCGDPIDRAAAMTYLAGDSLLLADRSSQLLSISTAGARGFLADLNHISKGLSFADLPLADLSLSKSAAPEPVTVGETLTYTLTLSNSGPEEFPEVTVIDELPGTVGLVSAAPSQGVCEVEVCGGLACSIGSVASGDSATVTLDVTPLAAGSLTNTALAPALTDPDPTNNQAEAVTTVLPAAEAPSLLSVDGFSNRLRIIDPGSGATLDSTTLTLPGEIIEGSNGLATHPTTGVLWALLRLANQSGRELVTLNPATGVATPIGNTGDLFASLAFDDGGTLYGVTGRGASTPESLFVLSQSDATPSFVLSLTDDVGGEALAFNPADGLLYHASASFESIDPGDLTVTRIATCNDISEVAALTYLGADVLLFAERNRAFYGFNTSGGLARVGSLDHTSKGLAFADLTVADLALTKTDGPDPATVGEPLTYTLRLTNSGPDDFPDAVVLDDLPGTVSLTSAIPSQGVCETRTCGGLSCSLGDLVAGASAEITLDVTPLVAGSITNTAIAPAFNDPDTTNNEASQVTTVLAAATPPTLFSIERSSGRLRVVDPSNGTTLTSRDIILAGETIFGGTGLAAHPTTGELWALLRLSSQTGRELVTVDPATGEATSIGNTGDRFAGLAFAPDGTLYGITGRGASTPESLFILSQTNATPTFVLSLANNQGGEAIAFNPIDGLLYHASDMLTFESVDPNGLSVTDIATCSTSSDVAALTHLGADVLLLAQRNGGLYGITTTGSLARIATLDHISKGLAFLDLPLTDLAVQGDDSPDPVTVGEDLTYTLTVTNNGPDDFPDATVVDLLPGTVGLTSVVNPQGLCSTQACGGLACSVGDLAAGASATVTLGVKPLAAGSITNTAIVTVFNDPDPDNNQATQVTTVLPADSTPDLLSVDQSSDRLRIIDPGTGATLTSYPMTLSGENIQGGFGLATHPTTGELWALLQLAGQGGRELVTLNPATGVATRIGDTRDVFTGLAFDNAGTLYGITERGASIPESLFILSQTDATWTFVVSLADGEDGEAIAFHPDNGLLYHATGDLTFQSIDLSGPTVTRIATCSDTLQAAAMTYFGADVLLLTQRTSNVLYGITTTGGLARIGSLDHISNGLAFADLSPADLSLTQSDSADPVSVGESLTYTLILTNHRSEVFPDATVFDALPGTAGLLSATPSQGTCSAQACGGIACSLGDLEAGASVTVNVDVTPLVAGDITNTAVAPASQDIDPTDNEAAETTTILPRGVAASLLSIDGASNRLRFIDPVDGTTLANTTIALDGEIVIGGNGLATHPMTGEVWALLRLSGQTGRELVTLEPTTGVATRIGDTGDRFAGLAFDNDGTLYGITGRGATTPEAFFILSQTTGMRTLLFSLANGRGGEAIAFHPEADLFYHASDGFTFESIDLTGPTVTHIATCNSIPSFQAGALTYLGQDLMLFAERDGALFSITGGGGLATVGFLDHRSKGLAFYPTVLFADGFESGDTSAWSLTIGSRSSAPEPRPSSEP